MKEHKDFKVIFTPAISMAAEFVAEYDTLAEAAAVLNALANYTLMLHECSLMSDYSNMGKIYNYSNMGKIYKNTDDGWDRVLAMQVLRYNKASVEKSNRLPNTT